MKRTEIAAATAAIAAWYLVVYLVASPLANAPVADSWIYGHSVRVFVSTGRVRFVGFTQAMPVAQVIYAAAWSRLFGASPLSLDLATALLGALGAVLLYLLMRRCGAGIFAAAVATGMMAANPCYLFLSFSFMTEIPFLVLIVAAWLMFASAEAKREIARLWLCAALSVAAFLVRPFAGAAIAGFAGAILLHDLQPASLNREWIRRALPMLAPFAAAALICSAAWAWLTLVNPVPWSLQIHEHKVEYLLDVPPVTYLRAGVAGPLLYLGVVLSPLAFIQLPVAGWRRFAGIAAGVFAVSTVLVRIDPKLPAVPEFSCFGGWNNALLLHGLPNRFEWHSGARWVAMGVGSFGTAGLIIAALQVLRKANRAVAAVMLAAGCYWAGMIPLWLFNDRYYLVMVPAGCLLLALATAPARWTTRAVAIGLTAIMAIVSLNGLYDYQRGLGALLTARDMLEREGVPRSAIDAGYALNGAELYRYLDKTEDSYSLERGIPMITSAALEEYTIADAPIAGTRIVKRLRPRALFGFSYRELYVLERTRPPRERKAVAREPKSPTYSRSGARNRKRHAAAARRDQRRSVFE